MTFDPNKAYTRRLPDCADIRNIEITVEPFDGPCDESHRLISFHECFTGIEWLQIVQNGYYYSFDAAIAAARSRVLEFSKSN